MAEKGEAVAQDKLATLILTLDPETKDFRIIGNVVNNKEATVGMLISALHMIYNDAHGPTPLGKA